MTTSLAKDARGTSVQQALAPTSTQVLPISTASEVSGNISSTNIVRIVSTVDCHVVIGDNPTATDSDMFLPANKPEWFEIESGAYEVAVVQHAAELGWLYITNMK